MVDSQPLGPGWTRPHTPGAAPQPTQGLEALSAMETPAVPEQPVVRHRLSAEHTPFRGRGQLSLFGFVAGRETHSGEIDG